MSPGDSLANAQCTGKTPRKHTAHTVTRDTGKALWHTTIPPLVGWKGTQYIMWQQVYDPLNSSALSALVAAVPIIFFLLGLTVLKLSGIKSAVISLSLIHI